MFLLKKQNCLIVCTLVGFMSLSLKAYDLETSIQKESYSLGVSTGNYLVNQIYNQQKLGIETDVDLVLKGFEDALKKRQKLDDEEILSNLNKRAEVLNNLQKEHFKKQQIENQKKEKEFLKNNLKDDKIKQTKSGLQYKIVKKGSGREVRKESIVVMNYKAKLIDGYVFNDTYKRKSPAHLSMINIIDGLKEGLLMMKEGGSAKFIIPSKLGYGSVQMRDIPPYSPLIFEVELLKVLKPGELKKKNMPLKEYEHNKNNKQDKTGSKNKN